MIAPKWRGLLMLDDRGPVWETARATARALRGVRVPFCIVGGLAVYEHGYRRSTEDVDVLIEAKEQSPVRRAMNAAGLTWNTSRREFVGPGDTAVHVLFAGERIASSDVRIRKPSPENVSVIDGLPVIRLAPLIEMKLAVGLSVIRRTHRDLSDVVELIARNRLTKAFASKLHRSLRREFRRLVEVARSPG